MTPRLRRPHLTPVVKNAMFAAGQPCGRSVVVVGDGVVDFDAGVAVVLQLPRQLQCGVHVVVAVAASVVIVAKQSPQTWTRLWSRMAILDADAVVVVVGAAVVAAPAADVAK